MSTSHTARGGSHMGWLCCADALPPLPGPHAPLSPLPFWSPIPPCPQPLPHPPGPPGPPCPHPMASELNFSGGVPDMRPCLCPQHPLPRCLFTPFPGWFPVLILRAPFSPLSSIPMVALSDSPVRICACLSFSMNSRG